LVRYFLYRPDSKRGPTVAELFIPSYQLEGLLEALNIKLGAELCIPHGRVGKAFRITFGSDGCPTPRYAGSFASEDEFVTISKRIPKRRASDNAKSVRPVVLDGYLEKFAMINRAAFRSKNTTTGDYVRRQKTRDSWRQISKRARRYLGLRPCK
jgi:hypothetical protein